ncbi:MAG: restriction endonuclease subunit S [Desulfomonile tiedjei]|nr:restriction endonuclease subunit S [Desulfomonile tiedjei]
MIVSEKVEKVIRPLNELSAGWQKATLAEVAEIIMGQSPSSQYYNSDGEGLPFFQGKAEFGELYPKPVKWCSKPNKVAQKDDILMTVRAPVGPTNLAITECCIGRGLAAIRPRNGVSSRYVLYYLRSIESGIDALGTGTTFKAISGGILRSIPIPIAPAAQQERIVAEIEKQFSRLDEAVANLKRVKANLKRYKAAVLKAAVEGKLTEDWRKQHPDVEPAGKLLERILTERCVKWSGRGEYKDPAKPDTSNLPSLPEKWTWASIDQLTSHITSGSRDWTRYYGCGSGTFILAQNVRLMRLDLSERQAVDPPKTDAETARTRVSIGDLLVTIVGAKTGEVCRIPMEMVDHFVCQSVALLRPLMSASAKFMELYLASPENGQAQWKHYIYGQGRPHLSFEQLKMTAIALPPLAEQQQIVAEVERRLSVIEELEAAVEANLTRADRLRQSILSQAFSGRLLRQDMRDISDAATPFSMAAESPAKYGKDNRAGR